MNKKLIEETLNQIIEMDYQATQKQKELLTVERERENSLRKVRRDLEFEIMKTARKTAKSRVQIFNQETDGMIQTIDIELQNELQLLRGHMEEKRPEIAKQLFDEIFENS